MFNFSESKNGGWSNRSLAGYLLHVDTWELWHFINWSGSGACFQRLGRCAKTPKALLKELRCSLNRRSIRSSRFALAFSNFFDKLWSPNRPNTSKKNWLLMVSQPIIAFFVNDGWFAPGGALIHRWQDLGAWVPCGASKNMGCQWELMGYSWDIHGIFLGYSLVLDRGNRFTYLSGRWKVCQAAGK